VLAPERARIWRVPLMSTISFSCRSSLTAGVALGFALG